MDNILNNIADPSWWFTGLFFVFVSIALASVAKHIPAALKKYFRGVQAKRLRKIKSVRHSYSAVNYEIAKTQSRFILFVMVCGLMLVSFVSGPLNQILEVSKLAAAIISSPIYIMEFVWLKQDLFTQSIINSQRKLRITNKVRL